MAERGRGGAIHAMAAELPAPPAGADVAEYWRSLAQTKADELEAMQNDFLEFQETSQMTEEEVTHPRARQFALAERQQLSLAGPLSSSKI